MQTLSRAGTTGLGHHEDGCLSANYYSRKDQLLVSLLKWIIIVGAVAYVPSVIAAVLDGLYVVAGVDTLVYVALLALYFCPRAGYHVRLFRTVIES